MKRVTTATLAAAIVLVGCTALWAQDSMAEQVKTLLDGIGVSSAEVDTLSEEQLTELDAILTRADLQENEKRMRAEEILQSAQ